MAGKKAKQKLQAWSEARARHHLTETQVKMARELGMDPARLGKIEDHGQERWKRPLPEFIEDAYRKRFGRTTPDARGVADEPAGDQHRPQDQETKKAPPEKQDRSQPAAREIRETPRGSTIPSFPKQRIDD
jgi:hypothetical protein